MARARGDSRDTEVCVAGAGPAGLALATALADRGIDVVVLESGPGPATGPDPLDDGDLAGDPLEGLSTSRRRGPGGTAQSWNTLLRGQNAARYVPLDPIDFEARSWVPHSGWPFAAADLAPYYRRARALAKLGPEPAVACYDVGLASVLTAELPSALAALPNVRLETDATLTGLTFAGGRVEAVEWSGCDGTRGAVRANRVVLALGAVENARQLLLAGLEHDWLGRGFMEHPRDRSLRLVEPTRRWVATEQFYSISPEGPTWGRWGRFALAEADLRTGRLQHASATIFPAYEERVRMRPLLRRVLRRPRSNVYRITINLEQAPDRENRITLSSRTDMFGRPLPLLTWRWNPLDEASRIGVRARIRETIEAAGFGRIVVTEQPLPDPNAHHHAGTTRMSRDPGDGVVDPDGRVHGIENLFVAGASVFPTAGFANPTLTILALSLRLAEHLGGWRGLEAKG